MKLSGRYARNRDSARERFIGPSLCQGTKTDDHSASIDSVALFGPIVISLMLSAAGVTIHFYNRVVHSRAKGAVTAVFRSASFGKTLSSRSSAAKMNVSNDGNADVERPASLVEEYANLPGVPSTASGPSPVEVVQ